MKQLFIVSSTKGATQGIVSKRLTEKMYTCHTIRKCPIIIISRINSRSYHQQQSSITSSAAALALGHVGTVLVVVLAVAGRSAANSGPAGMLVARGVARSGTRVALRVVGPSALRRAIVAFRGRCLCRTLSGLQTIRVGHHVLMVLVRMVICRHLEHNTYSSMECCPPLILPMSQMCKILSD